MSLQKLNIDDCGVSGVVRELRAAPDFFPIVFKSRNSNKSFMRLLDAVANSLDGHEDPVAWAFYLVVMSDIDSVIATSISRIIVEESATDWLRALAYSYLVFKELT